MKIVISNPVLKLTHEEKTTLSQAVAILDSICNKVADYPDCKSRCPIYDYCPYHTDFTNNIYGKLHDLLDDIVSNADTEV